MRYFELFEARQSPLYHTMKHDKALEIFSNDVMAAKWKHVIPGYGETFGNSFSRNPKLRWAGCVYIVVDQTKLAQTNKIIPLDGDYVYYSSTEHSNPPRDRKAHTGRGVNYTNEYTDNQHLSEEFVIGNIKNFHRCVKSIQLFYNSYSNWLPKDTLFELRKTLADYSSNWNIPLKIAPEITQKLKNFDPAIGEPVKQYMW